MKQAESLMTFKEQLTAQADCSESNINIDDEINYIKKRMQECWAYRAFTIDLIVPRGPMAIGCASSNFYEHFVPEKVSPLYYRQLFVKELEKLGFDEIKLYDTEINGSYIYSIKVVW